MTEFEVIPADALGVFARGHGEPGRELVGYVVQLGKRWDAYWRLPSEIFIMQKVGQYASCEKALAKVKAMTLVARGELDVPQYSDARSDFPLED